MLEDVKVQIHTYDAEMGRTGGGMFNATAQSGSNRIHGGGFLLMRPGSLIGQNFFLKLQGRPQPERVLAQPGGRIRRARSCSGKTFFWAAAEGYRDGLTQNGNLHVPTAAECAGDFSALTDSSGRPIIIYDPLTTDPVERRTPAVSRQPHSRQPLQPGRRQHREVPAAAEHRQSQRRQRQPELRRREHSEEPRPAGERERSITTSTTASR